MEETVPKPNSVGPVGNSCFARWLSLDRTDIRFVMPRSTFSYAIASRGAAVAALLAGCGPGPLPLPPGPDLDALVVKYQAPTGTIDPQQINDVIVAAQTRLGQLHLDWLPDLLAQSMTRLRERLDDNGVPSDPSAAPNLDHPGIDATIRLAQTCRGWDDPIGTRTCRRKWNAFADRSGREPNVPSRAGRGGESCRGRIQPTNQIEVATGRRSQGVRRWTHSGFISTHRCPGPSPRPTPWCTSRVKSARWPVAMYRANSISSSTIRTSRSASTAPTAT